MSGKSGNNGNAHSMAVGVCICLLYLSGCASTPQSRQLIEQHSTHYEQAVELTGVPFFAQEKYQCGPAALATLLNTAGVAVTDQDLVPKVYLPGRRGSLQVELLAASRSYQRLPYILPRELTALLNEVRAGRPVLVFQNLGLRVYPQWHYAVLVGYDLSQQQVILRSGTHRRYVMSMQLFERTWQRTNHWAMVLLRPGEIPVDDDPSRYFQSVVGFARSGSVEHRGKALKAGVLRWPQDRLLNLGLGNFHYELGDKQQAMQSYRRVLHYHPDDADAHNNLAQVLLDQDQLQQALVHAQRAVSLGGAHQQQYRATLDSIRGKLAP